MIGDLYQVIWKSPGFAQSGNPYGFIWVPDL